MSIYKQYDHHGVIIKFLRPNHFPNKIIENQPKRKILETIGEPSTKYFQTIQKMYPNVPIHFLCKKTHRHGNDCYSNLDKDLPGMRSISSYVMFNITLINQYWQEYKSRLDNFYLYTAYLDNRKSTEHGSEIRVTALLNRHASFKQLHKHYCVIWSDVSADPEVSNEPLEIVPVHRHPVLGNLEYYPCLLTCKVPFHQGQKLPLAVSIVDDEAKKSKKYIPSNYLKVNDPVAKEKNDFAVCVKSYLLEENQTSRLVEWIELLSILGVKKIFIYELFVHPEIKKVLNYYVDKGMVDLTTTNLPGEQPTKQEYLKEYFKNYLNPNRPDSGIHLNDCLYRNIHRYKFIAILDVDEVIVPRKKGQTWSDLVTSLSRNKAIVDYRFKNTYFFDDIPVYNSSSNDNIVEIPNVMHMLRHVYRSKRNHIGKSIIDTARVKIVNSHIALHCLHNSCKHVDVDPSIAQVQHYRKGCSTLAGSEKQCYQNYRKETVLDTTLWAFKNELVSRSLKTLSMLGLQS